ncbi:MAG: type II toxin-antitoxin system HicA family toxin [Gammaproteobacteria bacterium]|nr:type II toxin-antitoxin system HicA family toxin [Gammaproteobacteria bacterium]
MPRRARRCGPTRDVADTVGSAALRRNGGHVVRQKSEGGTTVTVPVPDHRELRVGTLRSIIRQSGLPRSVVE